jgi:hypothetical protein
MPRLGYKPTPEHRAKIGAAHKGKKWRLGHKHTAGTRAKMSTAHKGRTFTPEHRAKLKAALARPEVRAKMSAAKRAAWARRPLERGEAPMP